MNWIHIAYMFVLIFLVMKRDKFANPAALRPAWITFALVPISYFVFALFRAGNFPGTRDLALIEIWSNGVEWLLLGISMLFLTAMIAPHPGWGNYPRESSPPPSTPPGS